MIRAPRRPPNASMADRTPPAGPCPGVRSATRSWPSAARRLGVPADQRDRVHPTLRSASATRTAIGTPSTGNSALSAPMRVLAPPVSTAPASRSTVTATPASTLRDARRIELEQEQVAALRPRRPPRSPRPSRRDRAGRGGTLDWSGPPNARTHSPANRWRAGRPDHGGIPPDRRRTARSCRDRGRRASAQASRKRGDDAATAATAARRSSAGNSSAAARRRASSPSGAGSTVVGRPVDMWIGWSLTAKRTEPGRIQPFDRITRPERSRVRGRQ